MALPYFQSALKEFSLLQTNWAAQLNPLLRSPLSQANLLTDVSLVSGTNTINHGLQRKLQGWFVVGQNAAATFYDKQATNSMPDLTLILVSSAAVKINLVVF